MNTFQLKQYMQKDTFIKEIYGGVLPRDKLPLCVKKPQIYIINTDPSDKPGTHWITIFLEEDYIEYFDSIGTPPETEFENFLILNAPQYKYNCKRIQNYGSDLCGQYCLLYSYFRCRGYSFEKILAMFSENLLLNDVKVDYFYHITS